MIANGAGIQVESGNWSKLHNQIWEALATVPLSGSEFRCLMFLFRQTYGWQKKEDTMSMKQWAKGTELDRRAAIRAVQGLLAKRVIYRIDNGNRKPATWGFNKYSEMWKLGNTSDEIDTSLTSDEIDTSDESVTTSSDKIVTNASDKIVTHNRYKDKKESSTDDAMGLVKLIQSYGFVYLDRNATALALQLVDSFGWDRCVVGIDKLKAAHSKQIQAGRRGITAPLAYLRSVLDGDMAKEAATNTGFVENAWQQLNDLPDYMRQ